MGDTSEGAGTMSRDIKKRGPGRPRKQKPKIRVMIAHREPMESDRSVVANSIRLLASSDCWATPSRPKHKDNDLDRFFIMEQIQKSVMANPDFRNMLLSLANAVDENDAVRAGFFAAAAIRSHAENILTATEEVIDKGLRALNADQKRSRMQKIRKS
jgi:hypothetical protein